LNFKKKYGNISFYGLIFIIAAASFYHFSAVYYYFLNPDHAIHILMTANFRFPHDLYFWGQDRLGSFVPLLGHLIYKVAGLNAVWSVSVVNYLILFAGYFAISTLFKNRNTKLILALFWFFPPLNFLDFLMIAQPFGIQMSLLAIAIYIFNKITPAQSISKRVFLTSLLSVTLIISLWVSDLTVISVFLLMALAVFNYYISDNKAITQKQNSKNIFKEPVFYLIIFWIAVGLLFITFAKSHADKDIRYTKQMFNDLNTVFLTIKEIINHIIDILSFNYENNIFLGLFGWLSVITILSVSFFAINKKTRIFFDKWFWFFLIQSLLALFALLVSHWVFRNGVSRRYFVLIYISLTLSVLLISDKLTGNQKPVTIILLAITAIAGLLSSTVHIYYPEKQKPKYEYMKEFRRLGKAGIISEYWNSYISAIAAPGKLTVTPNDKSYVRNLAMADSVFLQPDIYIIKDSWLDSFPERIEQFGYSLQKTHNPFELGGASLCEYKIVKTHRIFTSGELKTSSKTFLPKNNFKGSYIIEADSTLQYKYLVYGPFINLNKGKYKVIFNLKTEKNSGNNTAAILDVTSNYGKKKMKALKIKQTGFPDTKRFHPFELTFEIDSLTKNIEFRVYCTGRHKLWFDSLELMQIE
jgi:hypothetical protein